MSLLPVRLFSLVPLPGAEYKKGVTLDDLKVELTQLDATLRRSGTFHLHKTTPSQFVMRALEIEDQQ